MTGIVCKGSLALGSGCKACSRCFAELEAKLVNPKRSYVAKVRSWMLACFGPTITMDARERNWLFLEEAIELVQACGCTKDEAHQLVEYVFNRPIGEAFQEVGGVAITLTALCIANQIDLYDAADTELGRVWQKIHIIRAKQASKPLASPLPEEVSQC